MSTSGSSSSHHLHQQQQNSNLASSSAYRSSSTAAAATNTTTKYSTTHHHHKIEAAAGSSGGESSSSSSGGDEDVLHVVTNVYTIPIVKSTGSGGGVEGDAAQEIHITQSGNDEYIRSSGLMSSSSTHAASSNQRCRERHEHVYGISSSIGTGGGDDEVDCVVIASPSQLNSQAPHCELHSKKTCRETRKITKRVIDESAAAAGTADVTKSKFQIRSIVEIYENPIEQCGGDVERSNGGGVGDQAFFKTSTQLNEFTTKETFAEPLLSTSSQRGTTHSNKQTRI